MANPTTNYGWPMPTSTDLVTDLPADFALFGQPVDTSLKALNPETTLGDIAYRSSTSNTNTRLGIGTNGQVLAVSGGVPAWTTTADVTPLTTKGDVFTFSTVDARIGVGANNTVLTADSAEATGLKWATPTTPSFVGCSLTKTANQTTSAATYTVITFTSEEFDTNGFHDNSTNTSRITIPSGYAGKYLITGQITTSTSTETHTSAIKKNGSNFNTMTSLISGQSGKGGSVNTLIMNLAVADYVEFAQYSSAGVVVESTASNDRPSVFACQYLGA